jgi:hypothetical protein
MCCTIDGACIHKTENNKNLFPLRRLLIEEYSLIYKTHRLETLKLLTASNNFHIADSVKLKILFSVVVVSINLLW